MAEPVSPTRMGSCVQVPSRQKPAGTAGQQDSSGRGATGQQGHQVAAGAAGAAQQDEQQ